jgi:hypothetical protein
VINFGIVGAVDQRPCSPPAHVTLPPPASSLPPQMAKPAEARKHWSPEVDAARQTTFLDDLAIDVGAPRCYQRVVQAPGLSGLPRGHGRSKDTV